MCFRGVGCKTPWLKIIYQILSSKIESLKRRCEKQGVGQHLLKEGVRGFKPRIQKFWIFEKDHDSPKRRCKKQGVIILSMFFVTPSLWFEV